MFPSFYELCFLSSRKKSPIQIICLFLVDEHNELKMTLYAYEGLIRALYSRPPHAYTRVRSSLCS